ncbi:MAG: alpha/beta hydrolase [Terricaulis sp.]
MAWLQKFLTQLALSRSAETLVKESGGEPRTVRGVTLDPRMQFLEFNARKRAVPLENMSVADLRAQTAGLSDLLGGNKVRGVRIERIYITGRSHSVPARLYLPTVRDNSAAMLVYYHFGGGVVGVLENCERLCGLIAKEAGAPVLSVDYRLAPEHKFPAGLEDALQAYAWAVDNAARYGAIVGKAAVGGDSMGGNFTAIVAQETRKTKPPVMQLLIYPGLDIVSETPSMHDFADAFPLTADTLQFFMKNYLPEGQDPSIPRISPGRMQDLSGVAPALIYTAGFDMLVDQGEAYAQRLREAGVKASYACFETLPHGFVAMPDAAPAAEQAIRRIACETAAALKGQM